MEFHELTSDAYVINRFMGTTFAKNKIRIHGAMTRRSFTDTWNPESVTRFRVETNLNSLTLTTDLHSGQAALPQNIFADEGLIRKIAAMLRGSGVGADHGQVGVFTELADALDNILDSLGLQAAAQLLVGLLQHPREVSHDPRIQNLFMDILRSV